MNNPKCPMCEKFMKLVVPKRGQQFRKFWGCVDYPECDGSRSIKKNGEPETDDEVHLRWSLEEMLEEIETADHYLQYGDK